MSNSTVECGNCQAPTQQASLNEDGHCPGCASCRVSSPPPEAPATDVTKFRGSGHHGSAGDRLMREPLKSKIPIQDLLDRGDLNLPPSARVPRNVDANG